MPNIRMPDGQVVSFPDHFTREQINGLITKKYPDAVQPNVGADVAKSGASGFARGTADLIGLPGTIGDALNSGGQWLLRKGYEVATGEEPEKGTFFGGPSPEVEAAMIGGGGNPLSGDALRGYLSTATGGATDYQPKTTAGEYARTVGEFAPAAVTGPGGLLRKTAMATVPAVTSETAGQLTEGTEYEPWARFGGALAGGFATAGRQDPTKLAAKGAPTREALKHTTDDLYGQLRDAGIRYDADTFSRTVQGMNDSLLKKGFRPSVAKDAFGLVEDLVKEVGRSPDFDDINGLVQMVGKKARDAAKAGDNTSAEAFGIIRDKLDDLERTSPIISNVPMPAEEMNRLRTQARATALKNIKARTLEEIAANADTYQGGVESGIRNGISNLLRSKRGQQLFTGAERTALLQVAQGRKALRTLSRFGLDLTKLTGNSALVPTAGALGVGSLLYPTAGAALLAAGTAAKAVSPRLTQSALDQATAAVRSGKLATKAGVEATKRLKGDQTLRRLLSAQTGYQGYNIPAQPPKR